MIDTEIISTSYDVVKYLTVSLAMFGIAACTSACGVKLGQNTMVGTPSFAQTVYKGELELAKTKERRAQK